MKCSVTGLARPECGCPSCHAEQLVNHLHDVGIDGGLASPSAVDSGAVPGAVELVHASRRSAGAEFLERDGARQLQVAA